MTRLYKQTQNEEPKYFKDLKDGEMGVILGTGEDGPYIEEHIGAIVVKVHERNVVQILGVGDAYSFLSSYLIPIRILKPGELLQV